MSACGQCGSRISEPARCLHGHPQPDRGPVELDAFAKLVADRMTPLVIEALRGQAVPAPAATGPGDTPVLVDVHEIARLTGMSERWAYDHAYQIGGVKAGTTKRARWRFDPEKALALLAERNGEAFVVAAPTLEPGELPGDAPLLPVRGRAA